MMKALVSGSALALVALAAKQIETDDYQFTLYMAQFGKNY